MFNCNRFWWLRSLAINMVTKKLPNGVFVLILFIIVIVLNILKKQQPICKNKFKNIIQLSINVGKKIPKLCLFNCI